MLSKGDIEKIVEMGEQADQAAKGLIEATKDNEKDAQTLKYILEHELPHFEYSQDAWDYLIGLSNLTTHELFEYFKKYRNHMKILYGENVFCPEEKSYAVMKQRKARRYRK